MQCSLESMEVQEASRKRSLDTDFPALPASSRFKRESQKSKSPTKVKRRQASVLMTNLDKEGNPIPFPDGRFKALASDFRWFGLCQPRPTAGGKIVLDFPAIQVTRLAKLLECNVFEIGGSDFVVSVSLLPTFGINRTLPVLSVHKDEIRHFVSLAAASAVMRQDFVHAVSPEFPESFSSSRDGDTLSEISSICESVSEEPSPLSPTPRSSGEDVPSGGVLPVGEPSLPPPPPLSGDAPPAEPLVAAHSSVPVAPPSGEVSALPRAKKDVRKRRRRARYLRVDYALLKVSSQSDEKVTVLFRPTEKSGDLGQLHQGRLYKQLALTGVPELVRDIRGGALAVELQANADPGPFLQITSLLGVPVKASLPASQLCRSGVIHGLHPEVEEKEFLEEVSSDFQVIGFTRLARPGQSAWVAKLLFQGTVIPKSVRYAGRSYRVSEYRPKPQQCETCFAYGHKKDHCKKALRCQNCGGPHSLPCPASVPACVNCGGGHSATHPDCPARSFHAKVAQVRASVNLSAQAAKAAVHRAAKSYAEAARKPPHSCRPEPSRNTIFNNNTTSNRATSFVADVVAAVVTAAKNNNFAGLLAILEKILMAFTESAVPEGALRDLIRAKTQELLTPSA